MENYLKEVRELCKKNNCQLLYATYFGSTLYGTAIPQKSDTDIKGIFLPAKRDILLGRHKQHISFKTGGDNTRNSPKDIDIDLWSLSYWLLELLRKGDTGAIDLLFSPSNSKCVIYREPQLDPVFTAPMEFLDLKNQEGYIAYAINQARKYGIKGSRLGKIKAIYDWLKKADWDESTKLNVFINEILDRFGDLEYCKIVDCSGEKSLFLCGKIHMGSTPVQEFAKRIEKHYEMYGARARAAMEGKGIDWKALSHALRAIWQMQELVQTGRIKYPLARAGELRKVKEGSLTWPAVEQMILSGLDKTRQMLQKATFPEYAPEIAESFILKAYGEN